MQGGAQTFGELNEGEKCEAFYSVADDADSRADDGRERVEYFTRYFACREVLEVLVCVLAAPARLVKGDDCVQVVLLTAGALRPRHDAALGGGGPVLRDRPLPRRPAAVVVPPGGRKIGTDDV